MNKVIALAAAVLLIAGIIAVGILNFDSVSGEVAKECSKNCTREASYGQFGCDSAPTGNCGCQKAILEDCSCTAGYIEGYSFLNLVFI